jgi:hypothetical protein
MTKVTEIKVVLHTTEGDVTTVYEMRLSEEPWSIFNAKQVHTAMEHFRAYINDGYAASVNTVTY